MAVAMSIELAVGGARVFAQHLEGGGLVDGVAFHQDALGPLGQRAATERAFEVVVLGEAAQHDVDRALPVLGVGVGDVGEDAALGCLLDELGIRARGSRRSPGRQPPARSSRSGRARGRSFLRARRARRRVAPWRSRRRRPRPRSRARSPRARAQRRSARRGPGDPSARSRSIRADARSRGSSSDCGAKSSSSGRLNHDRGSVTLPWRKWLTKNEIESEPTEIMSGQRRRTGRWPSPAPRKKTACHRLPGCPTRSGTAAKVKRTRSTVSWRARSGPERGRSRSDDEVPVPQTAG